MQHQILMMYPWIAQQLRGIPLAMLCSDAMIQDDGCLCLKDAVMSREVSVVQGIFSSPLVVTDKFSH